MPQLSGSLEISGSIIATGGITVSGSIASASYAQSSSLAANAELLSGRDVNRFANTGSNSFNGNQTVTGSLTVTGQVIAQTLNVQQVTSSVVYSSGSNVFGNSIANTQQFTGSILVSGSINTTPGIQITGDGVVNMLQAIRAGNTRFVVRNGVNAVGINTDTPNNPLTVNGNADFTGIIGVNGATEAGWALKSNGNLKVENSNGTTVLQVNDTSTGGKTWSIISSGAGNAHSIPAGAFYLRNSSDSTTVFSVTSTGATSFTGDTTNPIASFTNLNTAGTGNGILVDVNSQLGTDNYVANFISNGTSRLYVREDGNVGIGTTSPNVKLDVYGASPSIYVTDNLGGLAEHGFQFYAAGNGLRGGLTLNYNTAELRLWTGVTSNSYFQTFYTNGFERIRITPEGYMGVTVTSSTVSAGDLLGVLSFVSKDTSTYSSGGITNIRSYATTTYNTGNVSGDLRFYTSDGSQNTTGTYLFGAERLRITSDGNTLNTSGRISNAHTLGNMQEWVGNFSLANNTTISLFNILNQYDILTGDLYVFIDIGSYVAYTSRFMMGYTVSSSLQVTSQIGAPSGGFGISAGGTLYNETMFFQNTSGSNATVVRVCLRVWGNGVASNLTTGGADLITSSYLTRIR